MSTMSDNIWSTLRMTLSLMGRSELHRAVDTRDLDHLNAVFQTESHDDGAVTVKRENASSVGDLVWTRETTNGICRKLR